MKGRSIILDHLDGVEAAALLVDGRLEDLLLDQSDAPRPGAIFRAICDRPLKGQGGMMLRLPEGNTAFLRAGRGLRPGQPLLVQVTGFATEGKAVPVTDRVIFKSRYAIVTPGKPGINVSRQISDDDKRDALLELAHDVMDEGAGLILRSSAASAEPDEITEDILAMRDLCAEVMRNANGTVAEALTEGDGPHLLAWREWTAPAEVVTTPGGFADLGVLDQMQEVAQGSVLLGAGGMTVEPTNALVAVDVNTGQDTSPSAALKTNLAACKALPRALRLRGLGGQIVVDFVSMSKAHRKQIEVALRAAFRADPVETSLVGWTRMGLFELQRKKERLPLRFEE